MSSIKTLIILFLLIAFCACKQSTESMLDDAFALVKEKKYNDAVNYYNKILNQTPDIQLAFYNRGICYSSLKKYTLALNDFNTVVDTHLTSGGFYIEYNKDLPTDDPKIEWQVPYLDALYQRAQVKYYMDSIASSLRDFQACINDYYEVSNCTLWQGILYIKSNKKEKACEYFNKALQLSTTTDDSTEAQKMLLQYCRQ